MHPYEIREKILKMLSDKIDSGEEKNITREDINHLPMLFSDNNMDIGFPSLTGDFESKLSEKTIKEIEDFRRYL